MKILVVYDSLFGNTRVVAEAIAEGLGDVKYAVHLSEAKREKLQSADLLVVGTPVHRRAASANILAFLDGISSQKYNCHFAAFDTRYANFFAGNGTKVIVDTFKKTGAKLLSRSKHFIVLEKEGPLLVNQINIARAWGMELREKFEDLNELKVELSKTVAA